MSLDEQAIRVLEDRCRFCGVAFSELHHTYCNIVIAQRLDTLISHFIYTLNDVSRKVESLSRDIQNSSDVVNQSLSNHDLFLRHKP